jgi:hypothetical protein
MEAQFYNRRFMFYEPEQDKAFTLSGEQIDKEEELGFCESDMEELYGLKINQTLVLRMDTIVTRIWDRKIS